MIPGPDMFPGLYHCLMGRTTGTEPVAVVAERAIPLCLQYLHHRLLDEAIHHRRDAQQTFAAAGLRYGHSSHRRWAVSVGQQLRFQLWPVVPQVVRQFAYAIPSTPAAPLLALTLFRACLRLTGSQMASISHTVDDGLSLFVGACTVSAPGRAAFGASPRSPASGSRCVFCCMTVQNLR